MKEGVEFSLWQLIRFSLNITTKYTKYYIYYINILIYQKSHVLIQSVKKKHFI